MIQPSYNTLGTLFTGQTTACPGGSTGKTREGGLPSCRQARTAPASSASCRDTPSREGPRVPPSMPPCSQLDRQAAYFRPSSHSSHYQRRALLGWINPGPFLRLLRSLESLIHSNKTPTVNSLTSENQGLALAKFINSGSKIIMHTSPHTRGSSKETQEGEKLHTANKKVIFSAEQSQAVLQG